MKRIVVRGEPFGGKTTFLRKVAHDWSNLINKSTEINDTNQNLAAFKCVLPLLLRLTEAGDTLKSVILNQLDFLSEQHFRTINYLLETEPESVLFVLDGFDEYSPNSCKEITSLIKRNKYQSACCITTSRPEGIAAISKWRGAMQMEAELHGFGEEGIRKFIQEFFKRKSEDISKALIDRIFQSKDKDHMLKIAKNPGLLQIMCILWNEKQELSTNRERLFETFIKFLLSKRERRMKDNSEDLTPEDIILKTYSDLLRKLGELACSREQDLSMKLVFSTKEITDVLGKEGIRCGFFYRSHPVAKLSCSQVSFLHKLVQEYAAAYYLVNVDQGVAMQQLINRCRTVGVEHEGSLLRFVFYLSQEKSYQFISEVCRYQEPTGEIYPGPIYEELAHLAGNNPSFEDYHSAFVASTFENYLALLDEDDTEFLEPFGSLSCQLGEYHFVYNYPDYFSIVHNLPGKDVLFISMPCLQLSKRHDFCSILDICSILPASAAVLICRQYLPPKLANFMVNAYQLSIHCLIRDSEISSLAADLPKITKTPALKELVIRNTNNNFRGAGKKLGIILMFLPLLQKLDVWGCKLTDTDLLEMGNVLKNEKKILNIQQLTLSSNPLSDGEGGISLLLQCMPHLIKLDCKSCGLTSESLTHLGDYLSKTKDNKLQELDFGGNNFVSCGSSLSKIVNNLPYLVSLFLADCNINSQIIEMWSENIKRIEKLEKLDMSGNEVQDLSSLAKIIKVTPSLKTLWLYFSHATNGAELVKNIPPTLTELHLGSNTNLGLGDIMKHVDSMKYLRWLNLKYSSDVDTCFRVREKLNSELPLLELHI